MKILILLLVAVLLSACCNKEKTPPVLPKGWQVFNTPESGSSYLFPIELEDGTQCVAITGLGAFTGSGISCNWKHK